jgi:hypothetical protein
MPGKRQPAAEKVPANEWTPEKAANWAAEGTFKKVPRTFSRPKAATKNGKPTSNEKESAGPLAGSGAVKHIAKLQEPSELFLAANGPYMYLDSYNGVPLRLAGQQRDLENALTKNPKLNAAIGGNVAAAIAQRADPATLSNNAPRSPRSSRAERVSMAPRERSEFLEFAALAKAAAKGVTCTAKGGSTKKAAAASGTKTAKTPRSAKTHTDDDIRKKYASLEAGQVFNAGTLAHVKKYDNTVTGVKNFAYDNQSRIGAIATQEGLAAMRRAENVLNLPGLTERWMNAFTIGKAGEAGSAYQVRSKFTAVPAVGMGAAGLGASVALPPFSGQSANSPRQRLNPGPVVEMP